MYKTSQPSVLQLVSLFVSIILMFIKFNTLKLVAFVFLYLLCMISFKFVDLVIFACLDFREFVLLELFAKS